MGIKGEQWQKPDLGSWGARLQCWTEREATEQEPICFSTQENLSAPEAPLGQWGSQGPGSPAGGCRWPWAMQGAGYFLPAANLCPPTSDVRSLVCTLSPLVLEEDAHCTGFFPSPLVNLEFAYSRFFFFLAVLYDLWILVS